MRQLTYDMCTSNSYASYTTWPSSSTIEETGLKNDRYIPDVLVELLGKHYFYNLLVDMFGKHNLNIPQPWPMLDLEMSSVLAPSELKVSQFYSSSCINEINAETSHIHEFEIEYDNPIIVKPKNKYTMKVRVRNVRKRKPMAILPEWYE